MELQQKGSELCKGKNREGARELQLPLLNGDEPGQPENKLEKLFKVPINTRTLNQELLIQAQKGNPGITDKTQIQVYAIYPQLSQSKLGLVSEAKDRSLSKQKLAMEWVNRITCSSLIIHI